MDPHMLLHLDLAEWRGVRPGVASTGIPERYQGAVLLYLMRQLHHGHIPSAELVKAIQDGGSPPACGHLGCTWGDDHVH